MSKMISVIVPVYQVEQYIGNTIHSLCNQEYRDFEVILVDNNTRDNSISIAEDILRNHSIAYQTIRQEKQGLAATRNRGFEAATSEWVISIDSDDVLSPLFLKELYDFATLYNLNLVTCKYEYVDSSNLFDFPEQDMADCYKIMEANVIRKAYLIRQIPIMITNTLFRKSFLDVNNLRLDEEMQFGADLAFMWKALFSLEKAGIITKALYNYYNRPDSMMTAPKISKIETRVEGFRRLSDIIAVEYDDSFANQILHREILGLLATVSQFGSYSDFRACYKKFYGIETYRTLAQFPDRKVRIQNMILRISPILYDKMNKKVRSTSNCFLNMAKKSRW